MAATVVKHTCLYTCARGASWTANPSELLQSQCCFPRLGPTSFIVSMKTTTALQAAVCGRYEEFSFITQQKRWPQISLQNREKSYLSGHWGRIIISEKIRIKSTSKNREAASPEISISATWRHYFATIFFTRCCFGFTGPMWLSNRSPHPKLKWPERTSLILLPHFECLFRIQCFFRYSFNMHFSKVLSAVNIADQG